MLAGVDYGLCQQSTTIGVMKQSSKTSVMPKVLKKLRSTKHFVVHRIQWYQGDQFFTKALVDDQVVELLWPITVNAMLVFILR